MKYIFTNISGYNIALDRLKNQIKSIKDDNLLKLFDDENIFDYTPNMKTVWSQANFPLCILDITNEGMKSGNHQNSDLNIDMYILFNNAESDFNKIFNKIISTIRKQFDDEYCSMFEIEKINRNSVPKRLNQELNNFNPFYSAQFEIVYNNTKY